MNINQMYQKVPNWMGGGGGGGGCLSDSLNPNSQYIFVWAIYKSCMVNTSLWSNIRVLRHGMSIQGKSPRPSPEIYIDSLVVSCTLNPSKLHCAL